MSDTKPLRGAAPVNDEFEVGYDEGFEDRWVRAEHAGRWLLFAVVLLGLSGALGRGPLSHAAAQASDRSLAVDYEPVARYGTPTQVTLHLRPAPDARRVRVSISSGFVEPMGLQTMLPQPVEQAARDDDLVLTVAVQPGHGDTLLRVGLKPSVVGLVAMQVQMEGSAVLRWRQLVLP